MWQRADILALLHIVGARWCGFAQGWPHSTTTIRQIPKEADLYLSKDEAYYTHSAGVSHADRLLQVPAPPAEAFFLRFAGGGSGR